MQFRSAARLVGITRFWGQALHFLDIKLVLIPFLFFVLRVWSCIINILFVYSAVKPSSLHHSVNQALIILAVSELECSTENVYTINILSSTCTSTPLCLRA